MFEREPWSMVTILGAPGMSTSSVEPQEAMMERQDLEEVEELGNLGLEFGCH